VGNDQSITNKVILKPTILHPLVIVFYPAISVSTCLDKERYVPV